MNTAHADQLNSFLDKAMFAIVSDSSDEESLKTRADINQFFNHHVQEARRLLGYDDSLALEKKTAR